MKIPEYWAKAAAEDMDQDGKIMSFSCWRSSDRSQEEAHETALTAAKRILQSLLSGNRLGRYEYGETSLREEALEKITNPHGDLVAVVTRNAYGVLVLNTDRVMFIDLDLSPPTPGESIRFFFRRIFNRSTPSPEAQQESEMMRMLEQFVAGNAGWGLRLYRTRAGLRAIVTHDLFDPSSEATLAILRSVGSDPLYVRLCGAQKCFRARLTPKPWRCGHTVNPVRWPFATQEQQARFEKWLSDYTARQSDFATCRFLGTLGNAALHPEVAGIVEIHDRATRCEESLELA